MPPEAHLRHGESFEQYILEKARFGDRLVVSLTIAPEVLPVAVPFLAVQPLVENAVRHGLERKTGVGHVTITAADHGAKTAQFIAALHRGLYDYFLQLDEP